MKNLSAILFLLVAVTAQAWAAEADSLKFIHATNFELLGKGFSDTEGSFDRLPAKLNGKSRPPVWSLSKNCSGLAVRFRTNSRVIAARWEVTKDATMNHFAPSGIKGVDLYGYRGGKWVFVNSGRPTGKKTTATIISNMPGEEMEFLLYLPLYDGLVSLEIGVAASAEITNPKINSPQREKPVVFYGTSITQGGCASRAGMAYPNILSRMLDRATINLGFSGNGQLDPEIADAMADIDASCFVIDCLPNVTVDQMKEKYAPFLEIIRKKKPNVPILMVESLLFPHRLFDQKTDALLQQKNTTLKKIYLEQKKLGDKHLFYQRADLLIGTDSEATVDGVHLTDLGFLRMSEQLYPVIRKLIR